MKEEASGAAARPGELTGDPPELRPAGRGGGEGRRRPPPPRLPRGRPGWRPLAAGGRGMSAAQVSAAPAERRGWGAESGSGGPAVSRPREPEEPRRPELGSPRGEEAAEEGGRRWKAVEAPPPKENPWTRRRPAWDSPSPPAADGQLVPQDPGAAAGPGPCGERRAGCWLPCGGGLGWVGLLGVGWFYVWVGWLVGFGFFRNETRVCVVAPRAGSAPRSRARAGRPAVPLRGAQPGALAFDIHGQRREASEGRWGPAAAFARPGGGRERTGRLGEGSTRGHGEG